MKFIDVEYNRDLKALETLLLQVKRPGDFYAAGAAEIPMPRVEVEGAGMLSFPIPGPQIEAMVRHATQAPYGRGEQTIVDTSVRNVWQISPRALKIGGKSWPANFQIILSHVTTGLGCPSAGVSAELYKLLVYERDGFFLSHRDTEKTPGMFGTLVVTLPSDHRGGALRIRHGDREVVVESNPTEPSEVAYAAFYADCEHEVLPVLEGNRVCLIYNLIQEQAKSKQRALKAPDYGSSIVKAAALLEKYWSSPSAPPKIVWLLEHHYSPAGLSFQSLMGADAARARVLLQVAAKTKLDAHLGVVHIGETGGAEEDGAYYSSRGRGYRDYEQYDDEEEESEIDDSSFSAISVDDAWQYLDEWRDADDRMVEFGRIPLVEGELLPAGALDEEEPDESRLTGATGNEGSTYERSYHRAAIVLWPAKRTIEVLLAGGVAATLPYLKKMAVGGKKARSEAVEAARRVVEAWPEDAQGWDRHLNGIRKTGPSDRATMIALLVKLKAPALLERFIRLVVTGKYDGAENAALLASISVLGNSQAAAVLSTLVETRMPVRPTQCAELLHALPPDRSPFLRLVAEAAVAGLDGIGMLASETQDSFQSWDEPEDRRPGALAPEFISHLFLGLRRFEEGALCADAASKLVSRPEVFHPTTLVVPALERLRAERDDGSPAFERALQHLWTGSADFLLQRSEVPPQPPADWHLDAELPCTCADCLELQAFARDPRERIHRFRINKDRRRHLHQVIERHCLAMTHVTQRAGSPQTLVCTKDRRDFQARMKEYGAEIEAMGQLVKLAPASRPAAAVSKRLKAAIAARPV